MLERARQRREALKSRLKEASAVTGQKRNVRSASNSENISVDCEPDNVDEGTQFTHSAEGKVNCKRKYQQKNACHEKLDPDFLTEAFRSRKQSVSASDCNPEIPDHFSIPKSGDCARPNPGNSGLEFPVMSYAEKHALLLLYKLYINAVAAEVSGLKAALIPIEGLYNVVLW